VAMTRAQEMLILSGLCSEKKAESWSLHKADHTSAPRLQRARSPLDWIGPWLAAHAPSKDWLQLQQGSAASWIWRIVRGATDDESIENPTQPQQNSFVTLRSLQELLARLQWTYPHMAAASQAAKASVTILRREAAEEIEAETPF